MSAPGPLRAAANTRDDWETPDSLFRPLNGEFRFTLDGAANASNHKLPRWYGHQDDGTFIDAFTESPIRESIWINPTFGDMLPRWIELFRARWTPPDFQNTLVANLPASTGAAWFAEVCAIAHEVRLCQGRVPYIHAPHCACKACSQGTKGSNTGDTAIAIWRPTRRPPGQAHIWVWDWRAG